MITFRGYYCSHILCLCFFPEIILSGTFSQQSEVTKHQSQDLSSINYFDQKFPDFIEIEKFVSSSTSDKTMSQTIRKLLSFEYEFPDSKENEIEDSKSYCSSKTIGDEFSSKCFGRSEEEEAMQEEEEEEFELVEPMVFDLVGIHKSC